MQNDQIRKKYKEILKKDKKNFQVLNLLGALEIQQNNIELSINIFKKVISINPDYLDAYLNLGIAYSKANKFLEAIEILNKILSIKQDYYDAYLQLGIIYVYLKKFDNAVEKFQKAILINPNNFKAFYNLGNIFLGINKKTESLKYYSRAIELEPQNSILYLKLGNAYLINENFHEAIINYNKGILLDPKNSEILYNRGVAYSKINQFVSALSDFELALNINNNMHNAIGAIIHTKMQIGEFDEIEKYIDLVKKKINQNLNVIEPFSFLYLLDNPDLHLKVARIFSSNVIKSFNVPPLKNKTFNKKIKIGYFSPDLNDDHPILKLIPELFELHDKNLFEIYCFSFSEVNLENRSIKRIRSNCTEFINAYQLTSIQIIEYARTLSLDIAIDLCGHTNKSLFEFFQVRLAPIQINYLGYSSTMGSSYYDYIIVDKTIVNEKLRKFYTEKQIRLPGSYMICDRKNLLINISEISNLDNEIPKGKFVYCCFNNSYRFNLEILKVWVDILNNVSNSILWISENNLFFKKNIINFFNKFNLGHDRIFFAPRKKDLSEHLYRYKLSNLFLDTPYNAHSTAVDCLSQGTPLLTIKGQGFGWRVGASLLNSLKLEELITNSKDEYRSLAIYFGNNQNKLDEIKLKINNNLKGSFMDVLSTVKNLEKAYSWIFERSNKNLPADHIDL